MKFNLSIVPNALTVLNALSGIMAIIWLLQAEYTMMLWAFAVCLAADFLDGLVARLLSVSSVIGKDLDSLADAISFGTFPACLAYVMLTSSQFGGVWYLGVPGLLLAAAAIYRLARFNHSEEGSGPFTGLATPAMCISILGIFWNVMYGGTMLAGLLESYWVLLITVLIFAWLCISSIPLISNKILGRGVVHIIPPVLASLALIIPLLIFGIAGLAVFVPLYVVISLVYFGLIKSD